MQILVCSGTLGGAGDDKRGAGLVDEDTVHLVDDGEGVAALHHLRGVGGHAIVAEIVEAELTVRAVGDVAGILGTALGRPHRVLDAPHRQPKISEEVTHELRVAAGEVVIHRHQMGGAAGEGIEIEREGGDQRLALARLHLGDFALVKDDAADDLHVEGNHVPRERVSADLHRGTHQAAAGILHHRVSLGEDGVQRLTLGQPVAKLLGLGLQLILAQLLVLLFDGVDFAHDGQEFLDVTLVLGAENQF